MGFVSSQGDVIQMNELTIRVDYPSCTAEGVSSDEFAQALEKEILSSEHTIKIIFDASPVGTRYPNGVSMIGHSGDSLNTNILWATVGDVFSRLKNSKAGA